MRLLLRSGKQRRRIYHTGMLLFRAVSPGGDEERAGLLDEDRPVDPTKDAEQAPDLRKGGDGAGLQEDPGRQSCFGRAEAGGQTTVACRVAVRQKRTLLGLTSQGFEKTCAARPPGGTGAGGPSTVPLLFPRPL